MLQQTAEMMYPSKDSSLLIIYLNMCFAPCRRSIDSSALLPPTSRACIRMFAGKTASFIAERYFLVG
jgi:hypothetical protein